VEQWQEVSGGSRNGSETRWGWDATMVGRSRAARWPPVAGGGGGSAEQAEPSVAEPRLT